jgi:SAM-dependent methyltransferase
MSFNVAADAYTRFMGRYSEPLGDLFADVAGLRPGQRALDVGCGPGALTERLVARLGAANVAAVDPSAPFLEAARRRFPEVDVRSGSAENLPFEDHRFDVCLAQLVVHFMTHPERGLAEMARVTRAGGVVAACVWDHGPDGGGPLTAFWQAAAELDPQTRREADLPGVLEGQLAALFEAAGLRQVEPSTLIVRVAYSGFDDWWEPYTLGAGPAGAYVAGLDPARRDQLRSRCRDRLPDGPFEVTASAWCARGRTVDVGP